MTSKLGNLKLNDFTKGLILAVITAIMTVIYDMLTQGADITQLNWKLVLTTTVIAVLSYIMKQIGTNNKGEFLKSDR